MFVFVQTQGLIVIVFVGRHTTGTIVVDSVWEDITPCSNEQETCFCLQHLTQH